jgi:CheY-like chemotaxis protein
MGYILIIEDDLQNGRLAQKLLTNEGLTSVHVDNGEEGLRKVLSDTPDLVLVDLGLPDIDGETVIAVIRQQAHLKTLPLVAFTAYPSEMAGSIASAYDCDGVIEKPIDTRTFAKLVRAFAENTKTSDG